MDTSATVFIAKSPRDSSPSTIKPHHLISTPTLDRYESKAIESPRKSQTRPEIVDKLDFSGLDLENPVMKALNFPRSAHSDSGYSGSQMATNRSSLLSHSPRKEISPTYSYGIYQQQSARDLSPMDYGINSAISGSSPRQFGRYSSTHDSDYKSTPRSSRNVPPGNS